jgi:signal transduction histidine kinase
VEDSGNQITVQVQDDGPSIGNGEIDKIFNLSAQIKGQLHSDKEDLALGLPIAKQLVEMHGGRIWAENGKERGNSFHFTLPKSGIQEKVASAAVKERENLCLRS